MKFVLGLIVGGVVAFMLVVDSLGMQRTESIQGRAADRGKAEYYVDAQHVKQFRWLDADTKYIVTGYSDE